VKNHPEMGIHTAKTTGKTGNGDSYYQGNIKYPLVILCNPAGFMNKSNTKPWFRLGGTI
jgi:hypothetical protein